MGSSPAYGPLRPTRRFRLKLAPRGFSLVEVALALGILSFTLLSMLALLPIGVQTSQISNDEARAGSILSVMESDLRNTYPAANFNSMPTGQSQILGLRLPYTLNAGQVSLDTSLSSVTTSTAPLPLGCSVVLDASLTPHTSSDSAHYPFQATVLYTQVPASGLAPIQARLIVSWPSQPNATAADLTDLAKVQGFVQSYVTFPAP